jgi:hypothetical protein
MRLLHEARADPATVVALLGHARMATMAINTQPGEADLPCALKELS